MSVDTLTAKQQAHQLVEQLGPGQIAAVVHLLEVMIDDEDDKLTAEDRRAITESREYFLHHPQSGISFEEMVADCGFTMDQIRNP